MADHVWSVLCQRSIVDEEDGLVSLIDVVERIEVPAEPHGEDRHASRSTVNHPMQLVTWWIRSDPGEPETALMKVSLLDPAGKQLDFRQDLGKTEVEIDLEANPGYRVRTTLPGIPWFGAGTYHLIVEGREPEGAWRTVARLPLEVLLV